MHGWVVVFLPASGGRRVGLRLVSAIFLLGLVGVPGARGDDPGRLGLNSLRERAQSFLSREAFGEGLPYLVEMVRRLDGTPQGEQAILESLYFFIGLGWMQLFGSGGGREALEEARDAFIRYESAFPRGERMPWVLGFRADCYRGLGNWEAAADDLEHLLGTVHARVLSPVQWDEYLEKLVEALHLLGRWERGLPWFERLLQSPHHGRRGRAGAALLEAGLERGEFDRLEALLPLLAREGEVRNDIRFNLKLLEAGDRLAEADRTDAAGFLYALVLTYEDLEARYRSRVASLEKRLDQWRREGSDRTQEVERELEVARRQLETIGGMPSWTPALEWRRARNFQDAGRDWEAYWAFWRLAEDYPDQVGQVQDCLYAAFLLAEAMDEIGKVETVASLYLGNPGFERHRREIIVNLAGFYLRMEQDEKLMALCRDTIARDPADPFNGQLVYFMGASWIRLERYESLQAAFQDYRRRYQGAPMEDGLHYWEGLSGLFTDSFADARMRFTELLERFPDSPYFEDAAFRRAIACFGDNDFLEARLRLDEFTLRYPESVLRAEAELFLGEIAASEARVEEALGHYRSVPEHTSEIVFINHAFFQEIQLLEANRRYREMEARLREYRETYGERGALTEALFEQGRAFELLGAPGRMLALYAEAVERYGNSATAIGVDRILSVFPEKDAHYRRMFSETVAFLERLMDDAEFREEILGDRRRLFALLDAHPGVDRELGERLIRDREFLNAVREHPGMLEETRGHYRRLNETLPDLNPADFVQDLLARAEINGERTLAIRLHVALEQIKGDRQVEHRFGEADLEMASPASLVWLARRWMKGDDSRNSELAYAALERVLTVFPEAEDENADALMAMGELKMQRGNPSEAVERFREVQARFPGRSSTVNAALREGEAWMQGGQYAEAFLAYERILKTREWRGEAWAEAQYQMGMCLYQQGRYHEAHGFFERTFLAFSQYREWAALAYWRDVECLLRLGEPHDARRTLSEALELDGVESTTAHTALVTMQGSL